MGRVKVEMLLETDPRTLILILSLTKALLLMFRIRSFINGYEKFK
jgi:hypothetical protein